MPSIPVRPILALDLATRTGWASRNDAGRITSGVQDFSLRRGESPGMIFIRLDRWLGEMAKFQNEATIPGYLVVYEQAHHRGGAATRIGVGFQTRVEGLCADRNIDYTPVHTAELKKYATGRGNAGKPDMLAAAIKHGWAKGHEGEDEVDALCLLHFAIERFGER